MEFKLKLVKKCDNIIRRIHMKKALWAITVSAVLLVCSLQVNAQYIPKAVPAGKFAINETAIEIIRTDPALLREKYNNVLAVQEVQLEDSQLAEYAEAYEYDTDGTMRKLDCDLTLNKVVCRNENNLACSAFEEFSTFYVLYATTASKTTESSCDREGVQLTGCIGWKDNLGPFNDFEYASGTRSGSYTGKASYQVLKQTTTLCSGEFDTSFYATSTVAEVNSMAFRLIVKSNASNGKKVELNFTTSMFD